MGVGNPKILSSQAKQEGEAEFVSFLGALTKLRKATLAFFIFVRQPSWNNSALIERIFMKFDT